MNFDQIKILIGLGNTGNAYKHTLHNLGFIFIDAMLNKYPNKIIHKNNKIEMYVTESRKILLLCKSKGYMNLSGDVIKELKLYLNLSAKNLMESILVIHDEVQLMPYIIKYKDGAINPGFAGHNGLRSIHNAFMQLGLTKEDSAKFKRLQIGCNFPDRKTMQLSDYILMNVNQEIIENFQKTIKKWINDQLID